MVKVKNKKIDSEEPIFFDLIVSFAKRRQIVMIPNALSTEEIRIRRMQTGAI